MRVENFAKRLGKLGFWWEKEMMMGVGPNSFDTNKQNFINYLLTSEYLLKSVEFHYTLTPKFLTYTFFSFSLLLYITFLKHFFY
jgi:hypothetical protein